MKPRQLAIISGIALTCYLLGVWTAPAFRAEKQEKAATAEFRANRASGTFASASEDGRPPPRLRSHERITSGSDRISIPRESIRKFLDGKHLMARSYDDLTPFALDALTMLGATEDEKLAAKGIFEASAVAMDTKEKELSTISKPDPSTIVVGLEAVHAPAREIVGKLQDDLRSSLPPHMAEMLISSIRWEGYYFNEEVKSLTFTVRQSPGGRIAARAASDSNSFIQTIDTSIESDGSPLGISTIFQKWSNVLGDTTIVPQPLE